MQMLSLHFHFIIKEQFNLVLFCSLNVFKGMSCLETRSLTNQAYEFSHSSSNFLFIVQAIYSDKDMVKREIFMYMLISLNSYNKPLTGILINIQMNDNMYTIFPY